MRSVGNRRSGFHKLPLGIDSAIVILYNRPRLRKISGGDDMDNAFLCNNGLPKFEEAGVTNGATHWAEELVREAFGYQTEVSFKHVIQKAMQTCLTVGVPIEENFVRQVDGTYFLTRFACYLIAMNGDGKKKEVAEAQVYFAKLAETFVDSIQHVDGIDRLLIRGEVADGEKSLASTASRHGIKSYPFFQNAGYRGMYNMNISQLLAHKGVGKNEKLIDRMGKDELAAHLFRITQTDAKIKNTGVKGQKALELTAHQVGKMVRESMLKISGQRPENLPLSEHVNEVKKKIKSTSTTLKRLDAKKKGKAN